MPHSADSQTRCQEDSQHLQATLRELWKSRNLLFPRMLPADSSCPELICFGIPPQPFTFLPSLNGVEIVAVASKADSIDPDSVAETDHRGSGRLSWWAVCKPWRAIHQYRGSCLSIAATATQIKNNVSPAHCVSADQGSDMAFTALGARWSTGG